MSAALLAIAICLPSQTELTDSQIESYLRACANGEHVEIRDMVDRKLRLITGEFGKPRSKKEVSAFRDEVEELTKKIEKAMKAKPFPEPRLSFPVAVGDVGGFSPPNGNFMKRLKPGLIIVSVPIQSEYYDRMKDGVKQKGERRKGGSVLMQWQEKQTLVDKQPIPLAPFYECVDVHEVVATDGRIVSTQGILRPADEGPYKAWLEANREEAWERIEKLRADRLRTK